MKVWFSVVDPNTIEIFFRMETDDGTVAEGRDILHSGESFLNVTFEQFIADGTGEIEITER